MPTLRVYADTSVFGGCFDDEFAEDSKAFFGEVRAGRFTLIVSGPLLRELADAPEHVRNVLAGLPAACLENVADSPEVESLSESYVQAGIVGRASWKDAAHVAAATVSGADLIVSWNFKHIVHFDKINGYQGVNLIHGFKPIPIYSPKEVVPS